MPRDSQSRPSRPLGALAASVLLFVACLGSGEQGKSCACRPDPSGGSGASGAPTQGSAEPRTSEPAPEGGAAEAPASELALPDFADPAWTRVPSRAGQYLVCWRAVSGTVPRNEDFELEVWVLRDGTPVGEASLTVNAWMPEHGHGMLRLPRTERRADGAFRVAGMLLHMRGRWELRFDVLEGALSETAECTLEL